MFNIANQSRAGGEDTDDAGVKADPREPTEMCIIPRRFSDELGNLAPAIIAACVGYAIMLAIGSVVYQRILFSAPLLTTQGLLGVVGAIFTATMFAITVGLVWCAFVTFFVMIFVWNFVGSLQLNPSWMTLGTITGGLAGCMAALPYMGVFFIGSGRGEIITALILGPGLATVAGQIGGAWGITVNKPRAPISAVATLPGRFQFGVRQMLVACVWVSLLLTATRLGGLNVLPVLVVLLAWCVYHAATLRIAQGLVAWHFSRRAWRKSRST